MNTPTPATQSQSAFLANLPLEVRYQIYELVFGEKTIILRNGGGDKVYYCLCPVRGRKYHNMWLESGAKDVDKSYRMKCGHAAENTLTSTRPTLPLLLTCRQVYTESTPILWSRGPIFLDIRGCPGMRLLPLLKSRISPGAFAAIRSLEISFLHCGMGRPAAPTASDSQRYRREYEHLYARFFADELQTLDDGWFAAWRGLWNDIGCMKGLVNVRVWIRMEQRDGGNVMSAAQEARLFEPLMGIDWLREFGVEVTWPANEGSEVLLRGAPFEVVRSDVEPEDKVYLAVSWESKCSRGSWRDSEENESESDGDGGGDSSE
ncbi:hypothetical protein BJX64DRAFT_148839 [Aspergillus heterothallicus]